MASCCQGGSSHTYTTMYSQTPGQPGIILGFSYKLTPKGVVFSFLFFLQPDSLDGHRQMQTLCKIVALVVEEGPNIKMTGKTANPDLRLLNADRYTCGLSAWIRVLFQNANAQPLRCCRHTHLPN